MSETTKHKDQRPPEEETHDLAPKNTFKEQLVKGNPQLGCWLGMADGYAAEIAATAGFDWLLIDGEHAPNDIRSISEQIQGIRAAQRPTDTPAHPVVRLPVGETWMIKQVLDAGAQTILVPLVNSAEQAAELVRAVRYPPVGVRGVGSSLARASNFGAITNYLPSADKQICLLAQVENRAGMSELDAILQTDVDGVFIGPADLAADLGHIGNAAHPDVIAAVSDALSRIVKAGKAAGVLTTDPQLQRRYLDLGVTFLATGIDVSLYAKSLRTLAKTSKALI